MKALGSTEIKRLNRSWRQRTDSRLTLVLCGLSNPYNVGSILRSAAVFGVEAVHLVGATPGPEHAGVAKTSLGTERSVPTPRHETVNAAISENRKAGFSIIALELADIAVPMHEHPLGEAICLVIGDEAHGLSPAALAHCDTAVYLPQIGRVASLNVAAATSIALFEARRQRWPRAAG